MSHGDSNISVGEGRKKKKAHSRHEEAHEGEGPWIVSYADMMTLLFCFFVIMTSFANFDPVVVAKKSAQVAEHFVPGKAEAEKKQLEGLAIEIGGSPNLKGLAKAEVKDSALQITFQSSIMFNRGEVELRSDFIKNLDAMIGLIKSKNPDYRIMIEGHTDDSPVSPDAIYRSNWEISSARAASVVERFEYYGFKGKQLVSIGYGDTRPVVENEDSKGVSIQENRALNRRVVIKVLKPLKSSKIKSLGIDTFFEDSELLNKQ